MLGIPPERDWLRYCIDEACHVLTAGHTHRDRRWEDWFRATAEDESNLYRKHLSDPRTGKPPSATEMALLEAAARKPPVEAMP